MSNKKLIVLKPNGDPSKEMNIPEARAFVREQVDPPRGNPKDGWRLKVRGDEFGDVRHDLESTMERWEVLVRANDRVGDVVVIDIIDHPFSSVARWVETEPAIKQTSGNRDIDRLYTAWHHRYPNSRNAGICVYKITNGSPSQHCRWLDNNEAPGDGANACDEFLGSMEEMYDAGAWAVSQWKQFQASNGRDGLPFGRMIIGARIWDPFQGWHYYPGVFHGHNHFEGRWWLISGSAVRC